MTFIGVQGLLLMVPQDQGLNSSLQYTCALAFCFTSWVSPCFYWGISGATPICAQNIHLNLCSGITLDGTQGSIWSIRINPTSAACQANVLPTGSWPLVRLCVGFFCLHPVMVGIIPGSAQSARDQTWVNQGKCPTHHTIVLKNILMRFLQFTNL